MNLLYVFLSSMSVYRIMNVIVIFQLHISLRNADYIISDFQDMGILQEVVKPTSRIYLVTG